jgi:glycosyltransferase involved in cell wall biosynthesis
MVVADRFEPFRVDVRILFAKELAARGYRMDWLFQSDGPCAEGFVTDWGGGTAWVGRTDTGTTRLARIRKHLQAIGNELRMFRLLRERRYDAIVVKDKFIAALLAIVAGRLAGVPLVYWLSYPIPEESIYLARQGTARYPLLYLLRGHVCGFLLYRLILPAARHVLVQSRQMQLDVAAKGIPADRLTPVLMGVDLASVPYDARAAASAARHAGPPTVVYLGTLIRVRHLDFLVRAFARVRAQLPDARLLVVGDGDDPSDRAFLEEEARRCGISSAIEFTGFLPMERAWRHVADADVCVSPIYPSPVLNAGSPTKLIEYMAMGKAVVANDQPEQREVLAESGAGICVPWEEGEFAAAVVTLLRDREAAAAMGAKGRAYVAGRRDYPVIAEGVDELFRALLEGPRDGRAAQAAGNPVHGADAH